MTHADFKTMARYMGADVVFETAPCAVFTHEAYTVSVDIDPDRLVSMPPLTVADILATAGMMTDKELGRPDDDGVSGPA